ncbi:hypothetical protein [Arenimonas donghaensis]|uniref:Outer membrane protein beta-barrel domain-containing protein n=1 Tax=Arenimonas donghaensis DSM 18148 = HO3-R19 TaxID=1121014 RepID=A0A087MH81_9GAMM|nr:hypothetical protein [Arenimonas donghaensis]KFL36234.1 hypothetical protein N788_04920 [Arenimonas donghaensis DSM 18148 = HO3-R19]
MKRTKLAIALAFAATLPFAVQAQESPSNTWVQGSYVNADGDAEGHAVRGSFEFGESNVYGLAGVTRLELDNSPVKLDGRELGLGYALPLSDRSDLFAEAAYLDTEVAVPGGAIDGNGYRTSIGLRSGLTDRLEGLVKANYVDGDDFDGNFSGTVGGLVKLTPTWGITGDVTFDDDAETYQVGLRASF